MVEHAIDQDEAERDFVALQILLLLSGQSKKVLFSVIGIALTQASIYYTPDNLLYVAAWVGLVVLSQLVRVGVQSRSPQGMHSQALSRRVWYDTWVGVLAGSALGSGLFFFPQLSAIERGLITLVIVTVMVGALSNSAGHLRIYGGFCIAQIVPLALCWMLVPSNEYAPLVGWALGATILFGFTTVLYSLASGTWKIFDESCRIRFREHALNQRLQEALELAHKASQTKTRFLAAASHDLRQPLHTISFVAAALSLRTLDAQTRSMVDLLNKVSTSLSMQLESLLDISKLDAGIVQAEWQTISVPQLIQKYHSEFAPMARTKNLDSSVRLQGFADAMVRTDALLLQRIVMNICQNALKFTQQGHIDLLVRTDAQSVEIVVADTGCGIAAELQSEVFQEFFQVANHARDASKGMGLGLSIVQRLCALLEIKIRLESELGRGTTVHLILQRSPDTLPASSAEPVGHPPLLRPLFQHHVLVVDDEMAVRQAAQFLLQEFGCSVEVCEDLPGARQLCQQRLPDLILVDLRLRGERNGVEVLQALRKEFGAIPALLVTGDTSPDRLRLAKEAGIPLCHKPLSAEKLTQELTRLLPA